MINIYYLIPIKDANIINYSKIVGSDANEFGDTGKFICKTYLGVVDDLVMANYTAIKKVHLKKWMIENYNEEI